MGSEAHDGESDDAGSRRGHECYAGPLRRLTQRLYLVRSFCQLLAEPLGHVD